MSNPQTVEPYVPQSPPRKWVVTSTGNFYQMRLLEGLAEAAVEKPVDATKARPQTSVAEPSR